MNPVLDHVFSVFILPALCCHNCTSPPVKEAHPGKGICATSRFILVSLKPSLNFQQNLDSENTCWAQRWELHPKNAWCHSKQIFLSELSLEALGVKKKSSELFQATHFTSLPQKDGSFMEGKMTGNICKPVASSAPQGMGTKDKQM